MNNNSRIHRSIPGQSGSKLVRTKLLMTPEQKFQYDASRDMQKKKSGSRLTRFLKGTYTKKISSPKQKSREGVDTLAAVSVPKNSMEKSLNEDQILWNYLDSTEEGTDLQTLLNLTQNADVNFINNRRSTLSCLFTNLSLWSQPQQPQVLLQYLGFLISTYHDKLKPVILNNRATTKTKKLARTSDHTNQLWDITKTGTTFSTAFDLILNRSIWDKNEYQKRVTRIRKYTNSVSSAPSLTESLLEREHPSWKKKVQLIMMFGGIDFKQYRKIMKWKKEKFRPELEFSREAAIAGRIEDLETFSFREQLLQKLLWHGGSLTKNVLEDCIRQVNPGMFFDEEEDFLFNGKQRQQIVSPVWHAALKTADLKVFTFVLNYLQIKTATKEQIAIEKSKSKRYSNTLRKQKTMTLRRTKRFNTFTNRGSEVNKYQTLFLVTDGFAVSATRGKYKIQEKYILRAATALHLAIHCLARTSVSETALKKSTEIKSLLLVHDLIKMGADVDKICMHSSMDEVFNDLWTLQETAHDLESKEYVFETALTLAIRKGFVLVTYLLIKMGASSKKGALFAEIGEGLKFHGKNVMELDTVGLGVERSFSSIMKALRVAKGPKKNERLKGYKKFTADQYITCCYEDGVIDKEKVRLLKLALRGRLEAEDKKRFNTALPDFKR
eukprot:maker-scaffold_48-snap-gene-1.36-mRNA-1 protein AED:0.22 eAED:0.22 QI:36/1/1/1/1/1/2/130/665